MATLKRAWDLSLLLLAGLAGHLPEVVAAASVDGANYADMYQDVAEAFDKDELTVIQIRDNVKKLASAKEPLRLEALSLMKRDEIKIHRDLEYNAIRRVDSARLSLDVYESGLRSDDGARGLPIVLYIHGGAWVGGDKDQALFKPLAFVPHGFIFASANYRFRPEATLIEMAQSVADAAGWLRRNAPDYGADPDRIFLLGHSAGAHLVSLLGTNTKFLTNAGVPITAIRGVVSLDTAVYDLPKLVHSSAGKVQRSVFAGNESFFTAASPWHHVSVDTAHPPFLIFYSDGRPDAITQTIPFGERLRSVGRIATVKEAKGRDHSALDTQIGVSGDTQTADILTFFKKYSM